MLNDCENGKNEVLMIGESFSTPSGRKVVFLNRDARQVIIGTANQKGQIEEIEALLYGQPKAYLNPKLELTPKAIEHRDESKDELVVFCPNQPKDPSKVTMAKKEYGDIIDNPEKQRKQIERTRLRAEIERMQENIKTLEGQMERLGQ